MAGRSFERVEREEIAGDLEEWRTLGSWLIAEFTDDVFDAACEPLDLPSAILVFREWVESTQS